MWNPIANFADVSLSATVGAARVVGAHKIFKYITLSGGASLAATQRRI